MPGTPLYDALRAQDQALRSIEYRGATTAARFADSGEEFTALIESCGIYDLGFRARLGITGSDRIRWLNGMVTNNIRDLAIGHGVYTFLLNPQGHILGDMFVFNQGESLMVETDRSQVEKILATFDHYIIMDDVEVADISSAWTALGFSGPRSRGLLNAVGIQFPELQPLQMATPRCDCECGCVECTVIRTEDPESYKIWLAPKDVLKTWSGLIAAGAIPVGSEALEMHRIAGGVPLYGVDIRERDLPQETEQARALNFNKGCYIGQEIVERIRSRGNVHRKFTAFVAKGAVSMAAGAKIVAGEKEVGEITSAATVPAAAGAQTIGLGYIRREFAVPGREVTIGAGKAAVAQLPIGSLAAHPAEDAVLHKA